MDQAPYTGNAVPIIPIDYREHTDEKPFCWSDCPCHEDQETIARVAEYVTDGLMTPAEATDFVGGHGI